MTRVQVLQSIEDQLAAVVAGAGLPVYRRAQVPATPPETGYISYVPDWGQETQDSRGGPQIQMGSVVVVAFELFVPRGQYVTAYGIEASLSDVFRSWQEQSLHMISWRAEEPQQKAGGPFFQLNFYLGLERHEIQSVAA